MAFLNCELFSNTLQMATNVRVILPDSGELSRAKCVYLLHGLSDNSSGWSRYTAVEQYAREHSLAVIMPEVQRSFYTDMSLGLNYFSYVSDELPAMCRRMFGLSAKREDNYVMGLSMGGYGALKCALTYPERYAGCGSFSGVCDLRDMIAYTSDPGRRRELEAIFGSELCIPDSDDIFALSEKAAAKAPKIFLSCGEQDELYPASEALDAKLTELNVPHCFAHSEGIHSWRFWDKSVKECFEWYFG